MTAKITAQPDSDSDLWVFGYGSLMWRPGFEFIEQVPARLIGEHRALCVYSFDHRGTPEKPGPCSASTAAAPAAALPFAWRPSCATTPSPISGSASRPPMSIARSCARSGWMTWSVPASARWPMWSIAAMCNMPGDLSLSEQLHFVRQGHGRSGLNRDYVLSTVKAIEAEGFRDAQLHQLAAMLHE